MNVARSFRCSRCGKETIDSGDGWQSYVIDIPKGMRPRTYELCEECTGKMCRFLEGEE